MAVNIHIRKNLGSFCLDVRFQSEASRIGILGASGSGKSMTLKNIAGIETPDEGEIIIHDRVLYQENQKINVRPQERHIGYLFQNYALFPTMTVEKNIAAGLKGRKQENQNRVRDMVRKFRLEGLENRLPGELSGGQQPGGALARIRAQEPEVILLDEPFSALDMFLKDRLQQELMEMFRDYKGTIIMVSHDRDEIYRFSEELVIMDQGKVVTSGKTKEIFRNPGKVEAARLTGCKNISRVKRQSEHAVTALDWGVELRTDQKIPEGVTHVGFRAHEFLPVWGERRKNCIRAEIIDSAQLPFEKKFYIRPETKGDADPENICWFLQKKQWEILENRGMPDYLQFPEESLLFLEE